MYEKELNVSWINVWLPGIVSDKKIYKLIPVA